MGGVAGAHLRGVCAPVQQVLREGAHGWFITEPATVRQILEHVGERTTAPAIAPACSPPLAMNGQQLTAPEGVFEAIPELEFDQTANLAAEAGHDQWTHLAGADASPVPDLEIDQTLGL